MRSLLSNIPDLVWSKDLDGVYLACNEMFERLYNSKESEIIGKSDFDFVSH
jgi:PAS domain-containing protein